MVTKKNNATLTTKAYRASNKKINESKHTHKRTHCYIHVCSAIVK